MFRMCHPVSHDGAGLVVAQRNGQLLAIVDLFARYERGGGDNVAELGVLIKAPVHLRDRDHGQ
jgi:hypothetical protein